MGRLLERLLSNVEATPAATPATLATLPDPSPGIVAESQESQESDFEKAKAQRARLLALADDEGLSAGLVHRLDDADVTACDGLSDVTVRGYLHGLLDMAEREAGRIPVGWNHPSRCEGCGPVWLWEGAGAHVIACPWCWNRRAHKPVPRPPVTCGTCAHFIAAPINPAAGCGSCALGIEYRPGERSRHPFTQRRCPHHRPGGPADG